MRIGRISGGVAGVTAAIALAACGGPARLPDLDLDPLEPQNRGAHTINKTVDSAAFGPLARGYGRVVPEPARNGLTNLAQHLDLPHIAVQRSLRGEPVGVLETTMRFMVNTVFGFGGLLDPAAEMGLPWVETGVDDTLHAWGVPPGVYVELPLGGPGTQRDWAAWALDTGADPLTWLTAGATSVAILGLRGVDLLHDRYKLDPAAQALLYESADSYTAQRISYLQNMRARLQGGTGLDVLEDPYADF